MRVRPARFSHSENNSRACDSTHIFPGPETKTGVKSAPDGLAPPRSGAGVTHNVLAPRSFRWRFFAWKIGPLLYLPQLRKPNPPPRIMKDAAPGFSPPTAFPAWRCSD